MPYDTDPRRFLPLLGGLASLALAGCQTLGPASLAAGRGSYNDVIARTNAEQTLGVIVRMRYADPVGLLAVSNVTANLRFAANAGGQAGVGPRSSYEGNLVPLSAGVTYEDNPTISYTPVEGEAFLNQWLTPVSLGTLVLGMHSGGDAGLVFALLVERMNGLLTGARATPEQRASFARAATLLNELRELGIVRWIADTERSGGPVLLIQGYAPAHLAQVNELLRLLDLRLATARGGELRIPLTLGLHTPGAKEIALRTRAVSEILRGAADAIEVPEEHVEEGVVSPTVSDVVAGAPMLRIRSSAEAPAFANVAVRHRDWWYYVDDADLASKRMFQQLQMLFATRLAEAAKGGPHGPMLTLPVR